MKLHFITSNQQEMLILLACLYKFSPMFWLNNPAPTAVTWYLICPFMSQYRP